MDLLSRRDAIGQVLRVGCGALTALATRGQEARARDEEQFGGVDPVPPAPDPRFPKPPTWETTLEEIAPNVYAYIQAGGPGRDNASVANAGIVVGDKGVAVIDTLTAPMHAAAFIAAVRRVTAGDIAFFYVAPWCQNAHPSKWIDVCGTIDRMNVKTIVAGHGPLGGKAELADMRDYLVLLRTEARKRYDAKMTAGAAAADIRMGKYDNWIGPERIVLDVQRFYSEFAGTLTSDVDVAGIRRATEEYNTARNER